MRASLFALFIFIAVCSAGQSNKVDSLKMIGVCDGKGFCIPKIENLARPKGISIVRQSIVDYDIKTQFRDSSNTQKDEISQNESLEIKLKFPLVLKDKYRIYMGLFYKVEEFEFDEPQQLQNEFHQHIEDKPLRSIGGTAYLDLRFKGQHYFYTRASFSLNGDYDRGPAVDYFRTSVSSLYGTKVNRSKTWGYGLSYSYRFGQLAIYPILHYNKQFNDKLGFEMVLPVKTEIRYKVNPKNYLYFVNRLGGDNYVLNFDQLNENNLFLGKSHFLSLLTYEHEVYDFFWVTLSAGVRANINFDLTENNALLGNEEPFIDNQLQTAPLIRFGIFIVPPRKWMEDKR